MWLSGFPIWGVPQLQPYGSNSCCWASSIQQCLIIWHRNWRLHELCLFWIVFGQCAVCYLSVWQCWEMWDSQLHPRAIYSMVLICSISNFIPCLRNQVHPQCAVQEQFESYRRTGYCGSNVINFKQPSGVFQREFLASGSVYFYHSQNGQEFTHCRMNKSISVCNNYIPWLSTIWPVCPQLYSIYNFTVPTTLQFLQPHWDDCPMQLCFHYFTKQVRINLTSSQINCKIPKNASELPL